jgi:hypothetical protein
MEAKDKAESSRPPEGEKETRTADRDMNWREKKGLEEPFKRKEVRFADRETLNGTSGVELPYRGVKPLNTGARTQPVGKSAPLRGDMGSGAEEKQYRIRAPIQRDGAAEDLIDQIHNTEVMVKLGDLYGISRELREGERLKLTRVRQPVQPQKRVENTMGLEEADGVEIPKAGVLEPRLEYDALDIEELPQVEGVFVTETAMGDVPAGSIVAKDPVVQYLESLGEDTVPKQVYVARDSAPLRVTFPNVNQQGRVECVLDSGSQIVSMDFEQAKLVGLIWDPNIQIFMQSANRSMERSVGLARNVPFRWGDMTVYLQVHVIKGPAYKVLLGRPFDALTKSRIDNSEDGGQVITLTDPNTGKVYAVPTFDRVKAKSATPDKTTVDVMDQNNRPESKPASTGGFHHSSRN